MFLKCVLRAYSKGNVEYVAESVAILPTIGAIIHSLS